MKENAHKIRRALNKTRIKENAHEMTQPGRSPLQIARRKATRLSPTRLYFAPPSRPMADAPAEFLPSLFSRPELPAPPSARDPVVPQNTLYDLPAQPQTTRPARHITLFGFSPQSRSHILSLIARTAKVEHKEEGRNYVNIWAEDPAALEKLLLLNQTMINGEIIGVFRRNFGPIEDSSIYARKKGIFGFLMEYLFGS